MDTIPNAALYPFDPQISRGEVLAELAAMPERFRQAIHGADEAALERRPAPGEWSAFRVLCHVRDATLAYAARFRWMIFNEDPFLPDYDEDNWVAASKDTPADVPDILDEIAASRSDLVRVLSRLPRRAGSGPAVTRSWGPLSSNTTCATRPSTSGCTSNR